MKTVFLWVALILGQEYLKNTVLCDSLAVHKKPVKYDDYSATLLEILQVHVHFDNKPPMILRHESQRRPRVTALRQVLRQAGFRGARPVPTLQGFLECWTTQSLPRTVQLWIGNSVGSKKIGFAWVLGMPLQKKCLLN